MKCIPLLCLALGWLTSLALTAPRAHAADPVYVASATADINGDGEPDAVSVSAALESTSFTLIINGKRLSVPHDGFFDGMAGFRVLSVNKGAKRKYIAVLLVAPNDIHETRLFYYDGAAARPAGIIGGEVEAPGNGAIYTTWWTGMWTCHAKYAAGANGVFRFVPQAAYYVGVTGTAKRSFPIRVSATPGGAVVANVAPDSKISLLLYMTYDKGEPGNAENGYYLIKTQTGLCGWADYKQFKDKVADLPFAG